MALLLGYVSSTVRGLRNQLVLSERGRRLREFVSSFEANLDPRWRAMHVDAKNRIPQDKHHSAGIRSGETADSHDLCARPGMGRSSDVARGERQTRRGRTCSRKVYGSGPNMEGWRSNRI